MGYTVDGVNLDTLAFNVVNRAASWYVPARRGEGVSMAGLDGELVPTNPPFEPGLITLTMWAIGANEDGTYPTNPTRRVKVQQNLSKLVQLFTKSTGLLDVRRVDAGSSTKKCSARLVEAIDFESLTGGMRAEFAVALSIPKSFWEDINLVSQSQSFSGSQPQTRSYSSFVGSEIYMDDLKLSLTSTSGVTNPKIEDPKSGGWLQYTGTVSSSEILIVDSALGTVKKGPSSNPSSATNVMPNVTRAGSTRLYAMHVDNTAAVQPQIKLSATTASPTCAILVEGRRKYMAI